MIEDMGVPSWVVPVSSLGAICVIGLVFVWYLHFASLPQTPADTFGCRWWFPRTWRKGTQQEFKLRDLEQEERNPERDPEQSGRDRTWAREVIERAKAQERGEDVSNWEMPERPRWAAPAAPPPAYVA